MHPLSPTDMNPNAINKVFGPPGAGKTTYLLTQIEELLAKGLPRDRFLFLSFTKQATREARHRASVKLGIPWKELTGFRTIHSLAFTAVKQDKAKQVLRPGDYYQVCKSAGLVYATRWNKKGQIIERGRKEGDAAVDIISQLRCKGLPITEEGINMVREAHAYEVFPHSVLELAKMLEAYKAQWNKVEFQDMLDEAALSGTLPAPQFLLVDEAQDLSRSQWILVNKILDNPNLIKAWIAGDDDQEIYSFAGADSGTMLNLISDDEPTILTKSHRCPSVIQSVGANIICRVKARQPKTLQPAYDGGEACMISEWDRLPVKNGETWLYLSRSVFALEAVADTLMRHRVMFTSEQLGLPMIPSNMLTAFNTWGRLQRGEKVLAGDAVELYHLMRPGLIDSYQKGMLGVLDAEDPWRELTYQELCQEFGLCTPLHTPYEEVLCRANEVELGRIKMYQAELGPVLPEPKVRISTIHGSKGAEADNVVLFTDVPKKTYRGLQLGNDEEHRLWYVAVTRAKRNLWVVAPRTLFYYPLTELNPQR